MVAVAVPPQRSSTVTVTVLGPGGNMSLAEIMSPEEAVLPCCPEGRSQVTVSASLSRSSTVAESVT